MQGVLILGVYRVYIGSIELHRAEMSSCRVYVGFMWGLCKVDVGFV